MPSLFNPADREALSLRLAALEPGALRRWGRMDPAQMLAHCALGLEAATGIRPMKQAFLGRFLAPILKDRVLGERPFRRNGPTDPALIVSGDRDFDVERARLATLIDRFVQRGPASAAQATHAFLGRLDGDAWGRLMYKHLDHHLKQFGL